MTYTVKYEHPHFPDDHEFGVAGLGTVPNNGSIQVDKDAEIAFISVRGMTLEDALANDPFVTLSGGTALSADEVKQLLPAEPVQEVEENKDANTGNGTNSTPNSPSDTPSNDSTDEDEQ